MDSSPDWLSRLARSIGPPGPVAPLSDTAWRVVVDGRPLVAKVGLGAADEAVGLDRLARVAGAPPVPEVVLCDADLLVTTWVDQGPRGRAHEEHLGRSLAALHAAPGAQWGGGSAWIGACPIDNREEPTGTAFYGRRLLELARRCGLAGPVEAVVRRIDELVPPTAASLVHGDLWWGNVLWGADGRAWLIDPSVHGGHPEEDLAMLALFGTGRQEAGGTRQQQRLGLGAVPRHLLGAYAEVTTLAAGWQQRIELFQLYPLLVHAVLFGGSYRSQAAAVAARFS